MHTGDCFPNTDSLGDSHSKGAGEQARRSEVAGGGDLTRVPPSGFAPLAGFLDCVHCGLCHSACPTYVELATEADSPRGRIHLMRAFHEGTLALDADAVRHFDLCLGCRGCETACPSGVGYGALIEAARPWIEAHYRRPLGTRLRRRAALALLPYPRRLRVALAPLRVLERLGALAHARRLLRRLPPRLRYLASLMSAPLAPPARLAAETPAHGGERVQVQLLAGCVMPELFAVTTRNTVAVLAANGCRVLVPARQGCCGALSLHAGDRRTAERLARANVDAFEPAAAADAGAATACAGATRPKGAAGAPAAGDGGPPLIVNAAGCGAMMKQYGVLLANDPAYAARAAALAARVRDATEFLAALPLRAPAGGGPPQRVAYHDPCHLAYAQGIRRAPRDLLAAIPGITLVTMDDEDLCCGSAGHYNVMQPTMAHQLVARKVAAIRASGADLVATANAGCALQLEAGLRAAGLPTRVRHVLDLLADAYRGAAADG
jgi:glycolate oxidase iron-sulfur subunit